MTAAPAPSANPPRALVLAAFAVVYLVWGSTYLAIAYAVRTLPPFLMAGVRFLVSGAVLYAWMRMRGAPRPDRAHWRTAATSGGLLLLGGTATLGWAVQWVPSGIASLLVATVPLWMVVLEWAGPAKARPGAGVLAGVAVGLAGVAVLIGPGLLAGSGELRPAAAGVLLLASVLWAAGSLYSRGAPLPSPPLLGIGMEMLAGGALCAAAGLLLGEGWALDPRAVSAESAAALAYLIVFGALLGFTAYLWLLRVSTPSRVATHAYVNPVVAVLLGWMVAGEPLTARTLLAAGIIVGSVALITAGGRAAPPPDERLPGVSEG